MRVSLQEFYCEIYCVIIVYLFCFFFFFLLAELAEYVLKDQQEKQVEDTFGKIYMAKINFLYHSVLANICTVLPHNLNTSEVSIHLVSPSFSWELFLANFEDFLYFCRPFSKMAVLSLTKLLIMSPWP